MYRILNFRKIQLPRLIQPKLKPAYFSNYSSDKFDHSSKIDESDEYVLKMVQKVENLEKQFRVQKLEFEKIITNNNEKNQELQKKLTEAHRIQEFRNGVFLLISSGGMAWSMYVGDLIFWWPTLIGIFSYKLFIDSKNPLPKVLEWHSKQIITKK